ncbi:MAG: chemotaxis protein CheA [Pseudohongiella sp.]|nr:chemotaxis protein CheA [Pseudohongiella sp.]
MSFFDDDEILEDFLVEAGEILELLSEQLVQLEKQPADKNLLNAIFRGFHTVKGGAGFLQLGAMVDCCHVTENLFDNLRNGRQQVTPALMDIVLQALDAVNLMFDNVKQRTPPAPASAELLDALEALANGDDVPQLASSQMASVSVKTDDEITDDEFDQLLAALDAAPSAEQQQDPLAASNSDNEISDEEFEALLDQMQGKAAAPEPVETPANTSVESATMQSDSNEISDDEFEALLDQLHGGGRHLGVPDAAEVPATSGASATSAKSGKSSATLPPAATSVPVLRAVPVPEKPESRDTAPETTVRVDTKRLDEIMNMVGELVLVRNRLVRIGSNSTDEILSKAVANLDLVTADLQTSVMKTRMQPIKKVFGRFPRVVRDLARSLNKEVVLELIGEETDLDKNLVEALADPLVHLVRNAVDHGIEQPDVRIAKGKSREGSILLAAEQEGDHILLTISDDGHGMDPELLRRKAVEKGLMDKDAADRLSRSECFDLIFAPGFSTKTEISDVSGRGVGMDVVKTKIAQLNGSVSIDSTLGKGSRIEIKVPLTLAIMPTMMIMVGDQTFALPLVSVNEIFNLDLGDTHIIDGQQVVTVRDKALPLFHLRRWLGQSEVANNGTTGSANVVIVSVGAQRVGFVVDTLIGQEEVVIKPLGRMLHGTAGMAGATITGDGRIAVILDVPGLLKKYAA